MVLVAIRRGIFATNGEGGTPLGVVHGDDVLEDYKAIGVLDVEEDVQNEAREEKMAN